MPLLPDLAVYVHWPFCQAKCPYCDFNSHVARSVDYNRWARAFASEISRFHKDIGEARITSVFFGGGTPSLMPPDLVDHILAEIRKTWPVANDYEVTLEANPTSVEAARFEGYRDAGVSRVSVGVQSLRDEHLRALGRLHSAAEARKAVETAGRVFNAVSADLIYARQDQSLADWQAELAEAVDLGLDHLSLYQLTIEDGTAFASRLERGRLAGLPAEDLAADLFEATQDQMNEVGLAAYEVSNHARPGAESRHNLTYWRGGSYLGIGPGAHGRLHRDGAWVATAGHMMPEAWLSAVEQQGSGDAVYDPLSAADRAVEYVMMSLRLAEGCELDRAVEALNINKLDELTSDGFVWRDGGRIGTTPRGRPVLNAILAALLV